MHNVGFDCMLNLMRCLDDSAVPRSPRQSGGQSAGHFEFFLDGGTVRRTVRGIMQMKHVLQPTSDHMHALGVCGYTRTRGFTRTRPVPAVDLRVTQSKLMRSQFKL
jgi:hypothetical protein